jgi:hypothetical protein
VVALEIIGKVRKDLHVQVNEKKQTRGHKGYYDRSNISKMKIPDPVTTILCRM